MDRPLTPREKVELKPCPFCGGEAVAGSNFDNDHYVMCGADCDRCGGMVGYMKTEMAAIENWNRRTALASGSGDHAELARLADDALSQKGRWDELHDLNKFHAAANPATVLALLSEIAALRGEVDTEKRLSVKKWNAATARATQAERQRDELRKALEFYADRDKWSDYWTDALAAAFDRNVGSELGSDEGETARQVLANQGAEQ